MAETVFPKPLDQEVASINAHLGNLCSSETLVTNHVFLYRCGKMRALLFKYATNAEITGITLASGDRPAFWFNATGISVDASDHYNALATVTVNTNGTMRMYFWGSYNSENDPATPGSSRTFEGSCVYYVP